MTDRPAARPAGSEPVGAQPISDVRRNATGVLVMAMIGYLGLGVLQIFFAGLGVWNLKGQQLGSSDETAFGPHRVIGLVMAIVALVGFAVALIARAGRKTIALTLALLLIVAFLQSVLASLGEHAAVFGGLHALFGIGSLGVASVVLADTRRTVAGWS